MSQPLLKTNKKDLFVGDLLDCNLEDDVAFESEPPSESILGEESRFTVKDEVRQMRIVELTDLYRKNGSISARNEIVEINMGLIGKVIRRYLPFAEMMGVTINDLEHIGAIGLMKAIERYDSEKAAFSTYAINWIWSEVQRYLQAQGASMRLPSQLARILPSIHRTIQTLEQEKGHTIYISQAESFAEEIAHRINASVSDVKKCIRYAPRRHNLKTNYNDDDNYSDDELLSQAVVDYADPSENDNRMDHILAILEDEEAKLLVKFWLEKLPSAEMRTVICYTYGLGGLEVLPFQSLTQVMRMSPVQIKKLREEALDIMRVIASQNSTNAGG